MDKKSFLKNHDVCNFTDWLSKKLDEINFYLHFLPSRYVQGGLNANGVKFANITHYYKWNSSWESSNGKIIRSEDWQTTKSSISQLRKWLNDAITHKNDADLGRACIAVLEWGGVLSSRWFIAQLARSNDLVNYMSIVHEVLGIGGNREIDRVSGTRIKRFNSGLTKIHAFIDGDGLPIYDSRVGAAISMFYTLYCKEKGINQIPLLKFPVGLARGNQVRDPAIILGTHPAPKFYTSAVAPHQWAQAQMKLGWIIESILLRNDKLFIEEGSLASRCHAFEAGLFIVGYDLSCFIEDPETNMNNKKNRNIVNKIPIRNHGWVPTGHSFDKVINNFREFLEKTNSVENIKNAFKFWLMTTDGLKSNTASAYIFPLSENEFDLFDADLPIIKTVCQGGRVGLEAILGKGTVFFLADEREKVCLVDVWLTGQAYRNFNSATSRRKYLLDNGHAGTDAAANTLMAVGRNVGVFFDLLNPNTFNPTEYYDQFFKEFDI